MPNKLKTDKVVVAIDGPAGAGKSTIAKKLAQRLGFAYLDTGAMYRSITLKALRQKVNLESEKDLVDLAKTSSVNFERDANGLKVFLDGEDVSEAIRTIEVTNNTFYIARLGRVREILVGWQRDIAGQQNVVAEGRDIGTVVFPQAKFKFYLDADSRERCRRRAQELRDKGQEVDEAQMLKEIIARDESDFNRSVGPLKQAEDAILIDSTPLSIDEVIDAIIREMLLTEE